MDLAGKGPTVREINRSIHLGSQNQSDTGFWKKKKINKRKWPGLVCTSESHRQGRGDMRSRGT